ncbi:MAG: outer membrane lipoprotein carrier protein LolA, partial [Bacilli bacterium]
MKKIFLMLALSVSLFTLTGCNKFNDKDAISKLKTDNKKTTSYIITADMEIMSNEEKYTYDVSVNYKEGPLYKVILTNKNNSHTQIILKNKDGVYV